MSSMEMVEVVKEKVDVGGDKDDDNDEGDDPMTQC